MPARTATSRHAAAGLNPPERPAQATDAPSAALAVSITSVAKRSANNVDQSSPLLELPREIRDMVLQEATLETSIHVYKDDKGATFRLLSPFSGVCRRIEAELQRVKLTPPQWRQVKEITVEVYNLNFDPLLEFLDSLTQQEMEDLRTHGTKIIPQLRFGRCQLRRRTRREIEEQNMASLVDWLRYSIDSLEQWHSLGDWKCAFVIEDPNTTVIPWIRALGQFVYDLEFSGSGAMIRRDTLPLRQQISSLVDSGVDALIAADR